MAAIVSDGEDMAGVACRSRSPDIPVIKSLMPYTNKAIPITKPASCTPNVGEAIIETDMATATPPVATLTARETLPGTRRFSTCLTLRPDMMLATPLNRSAMAAEPYNQSGTSSRICYDNT